MQLYQSYACASDGSRLEGASITVMSGTTLATLYDALGVQISNPTVSGPDGLISFKAADGDYLVTVSDQTPYTIYLLDPVDVLASIASAAAAASSASAAAAAASDSAAAANTAQAIAASNLATAQAQVAQLIAQIDAANANITAILDGSIDPAGYAELQAAAEAAATAAQTAEALAQTAESQAAASSSAAAASASLAAQDAAAALTSANDAQTYSTSAQTSANNATTAASNASTSAGAAASSQTAAAGSATAASGYASTASTQAANAANSATSAQGFANTASSQASNALSSANAAATSASGAATSASNSANSASASNQSSVAATAVAASLLPSSFSTGLEFWTTAYTTYGATAASVSGTTTLVNVAGYGQCVQTVGTLATFGTLGTIALTAQHSYALTLTTNITADATNDSGGSQLQNYGFACFDVSGNYLGNCLLGAPAQTKSEGWQVYTATVTSETIRAASGLSATVYVRPYFQQNYVTSSGNAGNGTTQTLSLVFSDVTNTVAANAAATASATSASSAAASQSAAGASASAAQTSATNAQTYAGNAQTSAGQAATSASNASGSSNSAGTYATNASNSAGTAGNSASAAATSASTATTQATNAGTSASGAATSATQAASSATSAGNYATAASGSATNASNSASAASSSAAAASSSASAAQTSATLSASVGAGTLNANPCFANYPATSGPPPSWVYWSTPASDSRVAGAYGSAYGYQQTSTAGANAGFQQTVSGTATVGWYVMEADIILNSGSLAGAGMGLYGQVWSINTFFSTDADINGTVNGAGVAGTTYRFRKLAQFTNVGTTTQAASGLTVIGFTAFSAMGSNATATSISWLRCDVRPATQGEINGNQALTNAATALSEIATTNSTIASNQSAQATINSSVSAKIYGNPNMLPYGNFEAGLNVGWTFIVYSGAATEGYIYNDPNYGSLGFVGYSVTANSVYGLTSNKIPCSGGQTYTLSGNIQAPGGGVCYLDRLYFDSTGAIVEDGNQVIAYYSLLTGGGYSYSFGEVCPTNATSMQVRAIFQQGNSTTQANGYAQRIKLEQGTVATAYSTEGTLTYMAANVTAATTAIATLQQIYASYTLTATAGNVVTGMQLLSASGASTISAVIFQAENFLIKSASSTSSVSPFAYNSTTGTLTLQNVVVSTLSALSANLGTVTAGILQNASGNVYFNLNTGLMVRNNGSQMLVDGENFGASSDLLQWFGSASTAVASMTKYNGIFAMANDGHVYYGGSALGAGTLTNSAGSSNVNTLNSSSTWTTFASVGFATIVAGGVWTAWASISISATSSPFYSSGGSTSLTGSGYWRIIEVSGSSVNTLASGSWSGKYTNSTQVCQFTYTNPDGSTYTPASSEADSGFSINLTRPTAGAYSGTEYIQFQMYTPSGYVQTTGASMTAQWTS